MANLGMKNGIYTARFRYLGKEYKRSLKTTDRNDAGAALLEVQRVIQRLTVGILQVPEGVDPGGFIVSGGTLATKHARPRLGPTLDELAKEFQGNGDAEAVSASVSARPTFGDRKFFASPNQGRRTITQWGS